jgi:cadmium resistance protein CadD (predicted permease)
MISALASIAALYATVNSDDWTWLPMLYMSFLRHRMQIFLGYVCASAMLYMTCYGIMAVSDETHLMDYLADTTVSRTVGVAFLCVGLWRGWRAYKDRGEACEDKPGKDSHFRAPFLVAMVTVLSNGYNNVLVLVPAFKSLGHGQGLLFAATLPLFNLAFAGGVLFALERFRDRTLAFTQKYAPSVGAVAMLLLGLKILCQ